MPLPAPGTRVAAVARDLQHPRWLYVLPNGDILVAESDAPPKPEDAKGISGKVHKLVMKRAGSGTLPSANQITLLRDTAGDGRHVERHVFLSGLHSPIGMTLIGDQFYVADTDAVLAFPYTPGDTEIHAAARKVVDLPAGPINHHWTKTLVASPDGKKLYVGVGSNSNAGENGMAAEAERNAVWEIDPKTGAYRVYAYGLRNPVGLAWQPDSGALWVSVNERDELGDHLPPDYMTTVHEGGFYGFPYSYYGNHIDERVKPAKPAPRGHGHRARLRTWRPYGLIGIVLVRPLKPAGALSPWNVCRSARLLESQNLQRLQGRVCTLHGECAQRLAHRRAEPVCRFRESGPWAPGGTRNRQTGLTAGRR